LRNLQIVQTVGSGVALTRSRIEALLANHDPQYTGQESEFTGRPTTELVADESLVLKKRTELRYQPGDDERWIHRTVAAEQELGLHHPEKTWVILTEDQQRIIANVTPRLQPLDQWIEDADPDVGLEVLERLLHMYIHAFFDKERQLDPGLSNFGTDATGTLYYIDDESSPTRGLGSLAAGMATWFRQIPWADATGGRRLGTHLRGLLLKALDDPHPMIMVQDQLRAQFAADSRQAAAIKGAIDALAPKVAPARPKRTLTEPPRYIALIADIHANIQALDQVLAYVDTLPGAELWVLGDIVGYGPDPGACIERLRDRPNTVIIKGNHDHAVALGRAGRGFSPLARQVIEWTLDQLSTEERDWLMTLSPKHEAGDWLAIHGAPQDPNYFNAYVYHMTYADNLAYLARHGIRWCVHGHTHIASAYYRCGDTYSQIPSGQPRQLLDSADNWLINPGSVGQPRGGTPGCEFAIIDCAARAVEWIRLDYDMDATIRAIHQAGLPPRLSERLQRGR